MNVFAKKGLPIVVISHCHYFYQQMTSLLLNI